MMFGLQKTALTGKWLFAQAPWSTRTTIHSAVYDNKLWIFGGNTGRDDSWAGDAWAMAVFKGIFTSPTLCLVACSFRR